MYNIQCSSFLSAGLKSNTDTVGLQVLPISCKDYALLGCDTMDSHTINVLNLVSSQRESCRNVSINFVMSARLPSCNKLRTMIVMCVTLDIWVV